MKRHLYIILCIITMIAACKKPDPVLPTTTGSAQPVFYIQYTIAGTQYKYTAGKDQMLLDPHTEYTTAGGLNTYQFITDFTLDSCKTCEPHMVMGFYDAQAEPQNGQSTINNVIKKGALLYAPVSNLDRYGKAYISILKNDTIWTSQAGNNPNTASYFYITAVSEYTDPNTSIKYKQIKTSFKCSLYNVYKTNEKIEVVDGEAVFLIALL